jgi:hypothetical protein
MILGMPRPTPATRAVDGSHLMAPRRTLSGRTDPRTGNGAALDAAERSATPMSGSTISGYGLPSTSASTPA